MLWDGISQVVGYFFFPFLSDVALVHVCMLSLGVAIICMYAANVLHGKQTKYLKSRQNDTTPLLHQ